MRTPRSSGAANIEVVRRYLGFNDAGDVAGLDSLRASGFTAHVPNQGAIDDSRPIDAGILNRDLLMIRSAFPDLVNEAQDMVAAGDRVVVRGRLSGTFSGPLGEVKPTGRRIAWDTVHIYRLDDGLIAEAWFVTDTLGLLRQVGAVQVTGAPPPEAAPKENE